MISMPEQGHLMRPSIIRKLTKLAEAEQLNAGRRTFLPAYTPHMKAMDYDKLKYFEEPGNRYFGTLSHKDGLRTDAALSLGGLGGIGGAAAGLSLGRRLGGVTGAGVGALLGGLSGFGGTAFLADTGLRKYMDSPASVAYRQKLLDILDRQHKAGTFRDPAHRYLSDDELDELFD